VFGRGKNLKHILAEDFDTFKKPLKR